MNHLSPLVCRIAFSRARYIGPHNTRILLHTVGSVEELMDDPRCIRQHFPHTKRRIIEELSRPELIDEAHRIAEWCERHGVRISFVTDDDYPMRLAHCPDAPALLYMSGGLQDWHPAVSLSVVGTRNMTAYGQSMTDRILSEIAQYSSAIPIVSGLAYGVDIQAHRKALMLRMPTIAVLAHGLDRIYPAVHRATAMQMLETGAWISEYPPGTPPDRHNFVGRNRIIAGLSDATLVIEAGAKSGSLITAELAASYDREVLAVPGRATDRYSEGCNRLISDQRGIIVCSGEDVIRALGLDLRSGIQQQTLPLAIQPPIDHPLLHIIAQNQPIQINDLTRRAGLSLSEVSAQLFDLELDGHIRALPGGLYALP